MGFSLTPIKNIWNDIATPVENAATDVGNFISGIPKDVTNAFASPAPAPTPAPISTPTTPTTLAVAPVSNPITINPISSPVAPPTIANPVQPMNSQNNVKNNIAKQWQNINKFPNADSKVHLIDQAVQNGMLNPTTGSGYVKNILSNQPAPKMNLTPMQTVGNDIVGMGKAAVQMPQYFANTDIIDPARSLAADISNNPVAAHNANVAANQNLGLGTNNNIVKGAEKLGGNALQAGLYGVSGPIEGLVKDAVTGTAGALMPNLASKVATGYALGLGDTTPGLVNAGIKYGTNALAGSALNAGFNATSLPDNNVPITLKNVGNALKTGAETGAAFGTGGTLASDALPVVAHGVENLPNGIKAVMQDQSGSIGGNIGENDQPTPGPTLSAEDYSKAFGVPLETAKADVAKINAPELLSPSESTSQSPASLNSPGANSATSLETTQPSLSDNTLPENGTQTSLISGREVNPEALSQFAEDPYLSPQERAELIKNDPNQQTANQVQFNPLNPEASVKDQAQNSIAHSESVANTRMDRITRAYEAQAKLDAHDQELLYSRNDPNAVEELGNPHNPKQFAKAATLFDDAMDYGLAGDRSAGGTTLRYGNGKYAPSFYEATPEMMDNLNVPQTDRLTGGYNGFRSLPRKYLSYSDGEKVGLNPLHDSRLKDTAHWALAGDTVLRRQLLKDSLMKSVPEHISERGAGRTDAEGRPFVQAAGKLPFDVSPELNKYLENYKDGWAPKSDAGKMILKAMRAGTKFSKASLFFGTPFHYANELVRYVGLTTGSGHPLTTIRGISEAAFGQVGGYDKLVEHLNNDRVVNGNNTMDWVRKAGIEIQDVSKNPMDRVDNSALKRGAQKINPSAFFNRKLGEFGNTLLFSLARAAKEHGIDPESPEGIAVAQGYNHAIGRINHLIEGSNRTIQSIAQETSLAPGWLASNAKIIKDAVNMSINPKAFSASHGIGMYNPGDIARTTLLGSRATEAAFAIIGGMIATGALPTVKTMIDEAGLNANNPVPNIQGNSKSKSGLPQVIDLPTDPAGLAAMAAIEKQHFLSSRGSPLLASISDYIANKGWNGQPLANPNAPDFTLKRAEGAAKNMLPISYQNATSPYLSIKQGIVQDIGGRYKTNPNSPKMQVYLNRDKLTANLTPTEKTLLTQVEPSWDMSLTTAQKDAIYQNKYYEANKYQTLLQHPSVLRTLQQQNAFGAKHGEPSNPLFTLSPSNQKLVMTYEWLKNSDPGKANDTALAMFALHPKLFNGYEKSLASYESQMQALYQKTGGLKGSNAPTINVGGIPYPKISPEQQSLMTNYFGMMNNPKITPTQKYQFIANNPSLSAAFNSINLYHNAQRAALGEPLLKNYPQTTMAIQNFTNNYFKASKAARTGLRTGNPTLYSGMQKYLGNTAAYQVEMNAGQAKFQGTHLNQTALKNIMNMGKYDVVKGVNSAGLARYMLAPGMSYSGGSSGGYVVAPSTASKYSSGGSSKHGAWVSGKYLPGSSAMNPNSFYNKIGGVDKYGRSYAMTSAGMSDHYHNPEPGQMPYVAHNYKGLYGGKNSYGYLKDKKIKIKDPKAKVAHIKKGKLVTVKGK